VTYHDELRKAMVMLSEHPRAIFMGQGVAEPGTSMHSTLTDVPQSKRLEMPVAEELQMGMAIGVALEGWLPICIFPRWNFMLRAADQLVNHLDRLPIYSGGEFKPKIIIRTAVPSTAPFNPQSQHDDDFSRAFAKMLRTVKIHTLENAGFVVPAYRDAMARPDSFVMVEYTDLYRNERGKDQRAA
jgi:pyruvate/2-oxoglutarate/acetoin dehydrogenase E1 component